MLKGEKSKHESVPQNNKTNSEIIRIQTERRYSLRMINALTGTERKGEVRIKGQGPTRLRYLRIRRSRLNRFPGCLGCL